jgi:hypothetical protein
VNKPHVLLVALMQDEVEIVHQEGNEQQGKADVEDKIIRQVDQLVEYFNSLFQSDQVDIRWGRGKALCQQLHTPVWLQCTIHCMYDTWGVGLVATAAVTAIACQGLVLQAN